MTPILLKTLDFQGRKPNLNWLKQKGSAFLHIGRRGPSTTPTAAWHSCPGISRSCSAGSGHTGLSSACPVPTPGPHTVLGALERRESRTDTPPAVRRSRGIPWCKCRRRDFPCYWLPDTAVKKALSSRSIEQTFIEHLLSAKHCARCQGKYKE